jgi:AraC family transcriptional regulator
MSRLQLGEFYGVVQHQYRCEGLRLSELKHERPRKLPEHSHAGAYFGVLLGGDYREENRGHLLEVPPFSTVYHPPDLLHRDEIGHGGGWFFMIELEKSWLEELCSIKGRLAEVFRLEGPPLALRLYFAYKQGNLSKLEAEALVLELVGLTTGEDIRHESPMPRWLKNVIETVHDDPAFPHTVRNLARQAGVHPVHLARVFRHRVGCSLNHCIQGLRVQMALRALSNPDARIADIACDAGFTDQSYLTRIVKHWTGIPPAALRRVLQADSPLRG